jgi:hypothetical protein
MPSSCDYLIIHGWDRLAYGTETEDRESVRSKQVDDPPRNCQVFPRKTRRAIGVGVADSLGRGMVTGCTVNFIVLN